eukprot:SAG31_NODE_48_length_30945_cov_16.254263_7_plen_96_part_00
MSTLPLQAILVTSVDRLASDERSLAVLHHQAVLVAVERVIESGARGPTGELPSGRVQVRVEASDRRDAEVVCRVLLLGAHGSLMFFMRICLCLRN